MYRASSAVATVFITYLMKSSSLPSSRFSTARAHNEESQPDDSKRGRQDRHVFRELTVVVREEEGTKCVQHQPVGPVLWNIEEIWLKIGHRRYCFRSNHTTLQNRRKICNNIVRYWNAIKTYICTYKNNKQKTRKTKSKNFVTDEQTFSGFPGQLRYNMYWNFEFGIRRAERMLNIS